MGCYGKVGGEGEVKRVCYEGGGLRGGGRSDRAAAAVDGPRCEPEQVG